MGGWHIAGLPGSQFCTTAHPGGGTGTPRRRGPGRGVVAYRLLARSSMWLALARAPGDEAPEDILPRLEAVAQFVADLQRCLGAVGVDGISGALERYRLLREVLDGVSASDLEHARAAVGALEHRLARVGHDLDRLRRLKALLGV